MLRIPCLLFALVAMALAGCLSGETSPGAEPPSPPLEPHGTLRVGTLYPSLHWNTSREGDFGIVLGLQQAEASECSLVVGMVLQAHMGVQSLVVIDSAADGPQWSVTASTGIANLNAGGIVHERMGQGSAISFRDTWQGRMPTHFNLTLIARGLEARDAEALGRDTFLVDLACRSSTKLASLAVVEEAHIFTDAELDGGASLSSPMAGSAAARQRVARAMESGDVRFYGGLDRNAIAHVTLEHPAGEVEWWSDGTSHRLLSWAGTRGPYGVTVENAGFHPAWVALVGSASVATL